LREARLDEGEVTRLRELAAVAGVGRVRGDGVVVRVADGPVETDAVTGAGGVDLGRVLDRDLQDIVNALFAGGAEAVAINGQRLTSTSTIRAAGSAILVDFKPVTGPYEVAAIGPGDLARRFDASGAARLLRQVSAEHGLSLQVRRVRDLTLPAASEPRLRHARVPVEDSPTSGPAAGESPGAGVSPSSSGGG
jgi:uncharacterized protein YlxW (UPF0749 family)